MYGQDSLRYDDKMDTFQSHEIRYEYIWDSYSNSFSLWTEYSIVVQSNSTVCGDGRALYPPNTVDNSHMWLFSTENVTSMNENWILITLILNSHIWFVATSLDSSGESLAMWSVVYKQVATTLPRSLLGMQNLIPYLEPTEPESALWQNPQVIQMQTKIWEAPL